MEDFTLWFTTGFRHICDWNAIDHILFLMMMCIGYQLNEWKKVLVLITAFTAGHSLTLALNTFDLLTLPSSLVEVLIPLTIMITAVLAIIRRNKTEKSPILLYLTVLLFGCIHGLGFSAVLHSLLGSETNLIFPLLFFNLGIEAGQILVLTAFFLIFLPLHPVFRMRRERIIIYASLAVFAFAGYLAVERITNFY